MNLLSGYFEAQNAVLEIISASTGYVVSPADANGPLLDLDAVLIERLTPQIQKRVKELPPGGRIVGDEIYNVSVDYKVVATKIDYDPEVLRGIDESVDETSLSMHNDSNLQRHLGQKLTVVTEVGSTVELTTVIVTRQKASVAVKLFLESGAEKEVTLTDTDKRTQSFKQTQTVTEDREQQVSPMVDFTATLKIRRRTDSQRFKANVYVDGDVFWRMHAAVADGGLIIGFPIGQLLSEEERFFSVAGKISNISVVDQNVVVHEVPIVKT